MPTLAEIAGLLNVSLPDGADGGREIVGVSTLDEARPNELSFLSNEHYVKELATTRAAAVLLHRRLKGWAAAGTPVPTIVVDDAELAVAKVLGLFAPDVPRPPVGIDPAARIAPGAAIGDGAAIGPNAYVGERTVLGRRAVLHAGAYVGDDVTVGDDCEFFPNVVIRERITIGHRVTIHANSVLGTDGFGYRWDGTRHVKIPQIGTVVIEDDVEIGSCVCIDRGRLSSTRIGRGTKIDNLVQIGHNVQTGPHCIVCGQVGLAGSVTVGTGVVLGGQAGIRDHARLGDGSILAACSAVMDDVEPKSVVSGVPALPHRQTLREQAAIRRLPDLVVLVRKLEERLAALEGKDDKVTR
jgi:UDP-3-O-[3-hydroxymyristoyl] glucosamine N-acyltransferase